MRKKLTTVRLTDKEFKDVEVLVALERRPRTIPWDHWAVIRLAPVRPLPGANMCWMTHPAIPIDARLLVAMAVHRNRLDDATISDWARIVQSPRSTVHDAMRRLIASKVSPDEMVWYRRRV